MIQEKEGTAQYREGSLVFGSWMITRQIGRGSFGTVYEIQRQDFGEVYRAALKVITVPQSREELQTVLEEGMSQTQAEQYFYSVVEDIVREFAIMARLKGTANVVSYEDHTVIRHPEGIGWDILIRMELLHPLLPYAYQHPFARRDIIRLGIDLCRALELCQKYNIIHRDIKPENIFVSDNGDFKLGDFGIARTIEKTTSGLSKKGTYSYMAPEVYRGAEYGFGVDIYSLGIVLYRLLNKNRVPFLPPAPEPITFHSRELALAKRMGGEAIPQPFYGEGRLGEIVRKACAYELRERYSSPAQMRQELEAILYDESDAALIYPDGDELALAENQYASQSAQPRKSSAGEATAGTALLFPGQEPPGAMDGGTERTESVFGKTPGGARDAVQTDQTERTESVFHGRAEPMPAPAVQRAVERAKPKKKSPLVWIIAGVCCAALIAGGVIFYLQRQQKAAADRAEGYRQLLEEGTALCETDPEQAQAMLLEAQQLFPEDPAAYTSYAYALYCAREYERCTAYIEDELAMGKGYDESVQNQLSEILGAAYFEQGDYAAAASFFRLSTAGGDITVSAMRDYAVSLGRLGDIDAAEEVLRRMTDAGADGEVLDYVQAEVDYAQEDYLAAENGFQSLLERTEDPTLQKRALRSLAEVYRDCSSLDRLNVSPIPTPATREAELLANGIVEYGLRYDITLWEMLALAYFEAYHMDPSVPESYLTRSAEYFNLVIEQGVVKDYLFTNLYSIYYEQGDYEAAEQALKDYEVAFPSDYIPHALRTVLLITVENGKEQGERDYRRAQEEFTVAGEMITSSDDATYYQQAESLMEQLEEQGWL